MAFFDFFRKKTQTAAEEQKIWKENAVLEAQRRKFKSDLDRVIAEYARGDLPDEDYQKISRELNEKIKDISDKMERNLQAVMKEAEQKQPSSPEDRLNVLELTKLKAQVKEKSEEISKLRNQLKQYQSYIEERGDETIPSVVDEDRLRKNIYELLLKRYKPHISEQETKTAGEIRAMINSEDLTVQGVVRQVKEALPDYSFANNYEDAARIALKYVRDSIPLISNELGVPYWLSPTDVMKVGGADDEDKAVFLCSILKALGDDQARVLVVELKNGKTHAFVVTRVGHYYWVLDPSKTNNSEQKFYSESEIERDYDFNGERIDTFLFTFNNSFYKEYGD